jgi:cytochrome P450
MPTEPAACREDVMGSVGCPVDETFDPLSPEYLADPYAILAALPHREQPIFYAPAIDYYVLTRYDDIAAVFRDPASYSAAVAQAPLGPITEQAQKILLGAGHKPQPSMVSLDEPAHARLRKPAARTFSMKRVTAMIPAIEATTARLLDAVKDQPEFDLVAALAFPLPANIVFSLMGVPEQDFAQLKAWCGYRAALGWGRPAPQDQIEIATSMAAYRGYLRDLVDRKAASPSDDLASDLIAIHRESPDRLTFDEIGSILFSLSFAGHETTTGLIGNTVRRLVRHPRLHLHRRQARHQHLHRAAQRDRREPLDAAHSRQRLKPALIQLRTANGSHALGDLNAYAFWCPPARRSYSGPVCLGGRYAMRALSMLGPERRSSKFRALLNKCRA